MKKEVITEKQVISMMVLFICGASVMFGTGKEAKSDVWMSLIIALLVATIMVFIYSRILSLFPQMSFFTIVKQVFGIYIGNIINGIYIWFWFFLSTLILYDFAEFMHNIGLNNTPKIISVICMMILITWILKEGIETIGMWCELFVIVLICIIITTRILMIPIMKLENLLPILSSGAEPILKGAISAITFPFTEVVAFMGIFECVKMKKSYYKIYLSGLFLGWIVIFIGVVSELLVLGSDTMFRHYFPSYIAISRIDIQNFIVRIEIIASAILLFGVFVKAVVSIFICCRGIENVFNIDNYKKIIVPVVILAGIVSLGNFDIMIELVEWDSKIWVYYCILFQIIIPIIMLIIAEIKYKMKR